MIPVARLGVAVGASLTIHGAGLAVLDGLPLGLAGAAPSTTLGADPLRVSLRPAPAASAGVSAERRAQAARPVAKVARGTPPVPVYYPVRELDERPLVRTQVEPQFPAGVMEGERRIAVELYIGADGTVEQIAILSPGPHGAFEDAALKAFSAAHFTPGRKAGIPVRSRMALEVLFGEPVPLASGRAAAFSAPR
jgi:protein TonB